ncbi:head GIN domain-containing protein [Sediminitomix flava]|uniref:Putative autotransporter adhesin-like protein n=1 Tax=Sediminitomix flava TaxID=379075 RepID=A0A315YYY1_SEDFL|nr:head GIN domain-containing protein [Sediminitomix flava]PWJ34108.1 putative autotransporter adhesin-like protein [Sediminitomix flava]
MKKLNLLSILSLLFVVFTACDDEKHNIIGEGEKIEVEHPIDNIEGVSVGYDMKVFIQQSELTSLKIVGQSNIIDNLDLVISGDNILKFKYDKNVSKSDGLEIYITSPMIKELSASGASKIFMVNPFDIDELAVAASGDAHISAESLLANEVEVSLSGESKFDVEVGIASELTISMSGDSEVDTEDMEVKDVTAQQSGSSVSRVFATETLTASLSGSSIVYYKGEPKIEESTTGSSAVKKIK